MVSRKSTSVKNESSSEPDTTESEASSKNETYSTVFLASTKNKQLFVKSAKKACVVCYNIEFTVKCLGPCQSYFHKECLSRSEERYFKPIVENIENKKNGKRKRYYSKSTNRNEDSNTNVLEIKQETNEEVADQKILKDNPDSLPKSNGIKSICSNQSSDDEFSEKQKNSDIPSDTNSILAENECENVDKDIVPTTSKELSVDSSVISMDIVNEKVSLDDTLMCSLCKAKKTICFVCGVNIEDSEQKIVCKLCKSN